jgi:hypothetical protein
MRRQLPTDAARADDFSLPWGCSAVALALLLAVAALAEGGGLLKSGVLAGATVSMHVSVGAAGLLASATALYVVLEDARLPGWGPWASRLSLFGALGLGAGSALRALEASALGAGFDYRIGLEAPGLIAAVAVLVYLRIEQAWRSRSAGALVMGLALVALALDTWLMASARGVPAALGHVMDEHLLRLWHLGGKLGVLASVVVAVWSVARTRLVAASLACDRLLRASMNVGLSGFTLALLSALAMTVLPGPSRESIERSSAGLVVWLCFSLLYLFWKRAGARSPRLSAWTFGTLVPAGLGYHVLAGGFWL